MGELQARDTGASLSAMENLGVQEEVEAAVGRLTAEAMGCLEELGGSGDAGRVLMAIARGSRGRVH